MVGGRWQFRWAPVSITFLIRTEDGVASAEGIEVDLRDPMTAGLFDLTSGRLGDSIVHAERALNSVEARLAELRDALSGQGLVKPEPTDTKGKGKGKATGPALLGDDAVSLMTRSQMEAEEKELQGLREDLALKVRALHTRPHRLR